MIYYNVCMNINKVGVRIRMYCGRFGVGVVVQQDRMPTIEIYILYIEFSLTFLVRFSQSFFLPLFVVSACEAWKHVGLNYVLYP